MIIEFKVANYRSINEEQTLSFVADRATRHPENLIKRPGYRLLKAVGLFGANASGKSNLVKAIGAMATFVRDSATKMNDGDPIEAAEAFRLDPKTREAPSRFEITFVTDGTVYTYGFAVDRERVQEEWLSAKRDGYEKEVLSVSRVAALNGPGDTWNWNGLSEPNATLLVRRTRGNALFLSTAARENVEELLPVYRYIREHIHSYDMAGSIEILKRNTASQCENNLALRQQIETLLRDADTGIERIYVEYSKAHDIAKLDLERLGTAETFRLYNRQQTLPFDRHRITTSRRGTDGYEVDFDFYEHESNGTQRLFALVGVFLDALKKGTFLVLDEIDASMHPLLTYRLLEMFQSVVSNANGAQMLFTTHDPSLLDQELFRRDQIWLAEKWEGASTFFSLADIEPSIRSTESFYRNYLTGRYGGTPHLGPAFDMVETGNQA